MTDQTHLDAAVSNWVRETKLPIDPKRLEFRACADYFWKDREQPPQDIGCHTFGITFSLEITSLEAHRIELDPKEYDPEVGLTKFNRAQLVEAQVYPTILDIYDLIFGEP